MPKTSVSKSSKSKPIKTKTTKSTTKTVKLQRHGTINMVTELLQLQQL